MSLERQWENMTAGNVWGFSRIYVCGGALLGVAVHGSGKLEISAFEVIAGILCGFGLFKSISPGVLGPMDRALLRRRVPRHQWLPLKDVVSAVRPHLEWCYEDDEWLFLAALAEKYRCVSAATDFQSLLEAHVNNMRLILNQQLLPCYTKQVSVGRLAFWYALSSTWATRCDLSLARDGPLPDARVPYALLAWESMVRSWVTSLLPALKPALLLPMRCGPANPSDRALNWAKPVQLLLSLCM